MLFGSWNYLFLWPSVIFAAPLHDLEERASGIFSDITIYTPPTSYTSSGTLYARTVQLPNGDLLATWENYSPEPPKVYFPIYRSTNGGHSWSYLSKVTDQVNGWGLRYQPFLYVLPSAIGGYAAGTILLAGNSIPTDLSKTQIDLYASTDSGSNWHFVSHIASGDRAIPITARHQSGSRSYFSTMESSYATTPTNATPPTARNSSTKRPQTSRSGPRSSTT
jgi:hypothetical protein